MADSSLGRLAVRIGADVTGLRAGMAQAQSIITGAVSGLAKGFAGALVGVSLTAIVRDAAATADQIVESADAIGISVERFQELRFAALQSGISAEQFATSMGVLARKAGEAGITTDRAFGLVVRRMADAATQSERVAIAMEYFGRSGSQFALAFGDGGDAAAGMADELRRLGGVVDEDVLRRVAAANDRLDAFAGLIKGRVILYLDEAIPYIERFGRAISDAVGEVPFLAEQARRLVDQGTLDLLREQISLYERGGKIRGIDADNAEAQAAAYRKLVDEARRLETILGDPNRNTGPTSQPGPVQPPRIPPQGPATQKERAFFDREQATTADREAAAAAKKLANEVKELSESTRTPLETLNQEWARLDELLAQGAISWDVYARATIKATDQLDEISRQTKKVSDLGADLGLTFSSAFEDAIAGGEKFSEVLRALGEDLLRLVTRQLITKPLADTFSKIDFGSMLGALLSSLTGRASGGTVYPGQAYVVGERGPEVLVPGTAGRVLPGVGGGVTVNVIEAPGRGGQMQQTTRGGRSVVDVMVERIKSAVASDILRGAGPVSSALERTYGATRAAGAF